MVGGGSYDGEISWDIAETGDAGVAGEYCLALADGTYTFNMYDSWGDGWNGATASVTDDGELIGSGGLASGSFGSFEFTVGVAVVSGCTDDTACNYNPDATLDDGSCTYPDCTGDCEGDAVVDECGE